VPLFPFLVISWWCGLLVPFVGLYPVLCMKSDGGNFSFCAVDVLRLGVPYSSVTAWADGSPTCGVGGFIYKDARSHEHKIRCNLCKWDPIQLDIVCTTVNQPF
jgi:hypothetical protein